MTSRWVWLLAILLISSVAALRCPKLDVVQPTEEKDDNIYDESEVRWWLSLKTPTVGYTYYYDSTFEDAELTKIDGDLDHGYDVNFLITGRIFKYIDSVYNDNMLSLSQADLTDDDVLNKLQVLIIAFQDQQALSSTNLGYNFVVPDGYKHAHTKIILAVDLTTGDGFLIDHSYPGAPLQLASFYEKTWTPKFTEGGQYVRAQHMLCVSFQKDGFSGIIDMLSQAMVMPLSTNIAGLDDPDVRDTIISNNKKNENTETVITKLVDVLSSTKGKTVGDACTTAWDKLSLAKQKKHLFEEEGSHFSQCTLSQDDILTGADIKGDPETADGSNQAYGIIAHAPLKKRTKNPTSATTTTTTTTSTSTTKTAAKTKAKLTKTTASKKITKTTASKKKGKGKTQNNKTTKPKPLDSNNLKKRKAGGHYAPNKKQKVSQDSPIKQANLQYRKDPYKLLKFGPWHWNEVAKYIGVSLYTTTEVSTPFIPSVSAEPGVVLVYKRKFGNNLAYDCITTDHGKYAVSIDEDHPIVCFGDANQRKSQIFHAGIAICFEHENLWSIMYNSIVYVEMEEDWIKDDDNNPLEDQVTRPQAPQSRYEDLGQGKQQATGNPFTSNDKRSYVDGDPEGDERTYWQNLTHWQNWAKEDKYIYFYADEEEEEIY